MQVYEIPREDTERLKTEGVKGPILVSNGEDDIK